MYRTIGFIAVLVAAVASPAISAATKREEARSAAGALWVKILTKCDSDYYYGASTLDGPPPGPSSKYLNSPQPLGSQDVREFKGVSFVLASNPLTEADKLNGIEWEGSTRISSKAQRISEHGRWLDWDSDNLLGLSVVMQKKEGRWSYRTQPGEGWPLAAILTKKPACADVLLIR